MALKVRHWEKWQSYRRDRGTPPWIKVQRSLLRKPKWVSLSDAQKGQLVCIWMLAADRDGVVPDDPRVVQRLCNLDSEPDLEALIFLRFLCRDDATLASERRQGGANVTPR